MLVVTTGELPEALSLAGREIGASLRAERPEVAVEVARGVRPRLVLVDDALGDEHAGAAVLRAIRPSACAALVRESTPERVTRALHAGAETVAGLDLDVAWLARFLAQELARPAPAADDLPALGLPRVVGRSQPMRAAFRRVMQASRSDASVLVTGETGVGKEVFARALHRLSPRRHGPFVAINCAAVPEALLESELFGHERGSFTGAASRHIGRFELAHGGTLFLDEIGDLPLGLQAKLLRVLQERRFERVGGTEPIAADVRVIAATHRDLAAEIERGAFRSDLYYRIDVLSIRVPPLRERKVDLIPLFLDALRERAAAEGRPPLEVDLEVRRILLEHDWPGNVRELHNVAQHALTVASGRCLDARDLPGYLTDSPARPSDLAAQLVGRTMRDVERALILATHDALGSVKEAAEVLGISPRKIHYRLKEYRTDARRGPAERGADGMAEAPRPRVFLAEDDDDLRGALTQFLEAEGYEVLALQDGRALLERLGAALLAEPERDRPDVVLTDVRMPGATGLGVLERIRERGATMPVVLMSAFGDPEMKREAEALGATAFLAKPLDFPALQSVLRGATGPTGALAAGRRTSREAERSHS